MDINQIVIYILVILFSVILHEISHGYVAYLFGDNTAKYAGRLTLNPQAHIDIFGTIILPAICVIASLPIFGYAKPVPVNPYNISKKIGLFLVSAAGIFTNLLLAIIAIFIIKSSNLDFFNLFSGNDHNMWHLLLGQIAVVNIALALFNLIPVPPFDGFKIFQELRIFSHRTGAMIEGNLFYQLIAIFIAIQIFQFLFPIVINWVGGLV